MGGRLPWRGSRKHCVSESDPPRPAPARPAPARPSARCFGAARRCERQRGGFRFEMLLTVAFAAHSDGQEHLDRAERRIPTVRNTSTW